MDIKLKEIDKDTLKVGDIVGVAREVECGWRSSFQHRRIYPVEIVKVTPKRTKIVSLQFGEHDKKEVFYKLNNSTMQENTLALAFETFQDGIYKLGELRRNGHMQSISDEDVLEASKHMKTIMEIMEKYKE